MERLMNDEIIMFKRRQRYMLLIKNGKVITMSGKTYDNGSVLIKDKKWKLFEVKFVNSN